VAFSRMKHLYNSINALPVLSFFLVPTVVWMGHFQPFETLKEFVFAGCILLSAGLLGLSWLLAGRWPPLPNRMTMAVLIYYGYNLLLFLVFPYTDSRDLLRFTCLIGLFVVISHATDHRWRDRLLHTLIFVAVLTSVYSCFQFIGHDFYAYFWRYFGSRTDFGMRTFATFGHPNLAGGFNVFILPIILAFLVQNLRQKRQWMTAYLAGGLLLSLLSLYMSQTRGSWLAFSLSGSLFAALLCGKPLVAMARKHRLITALGVLSLGGLAIGLVTVLQTNPTFTDLTTVKTRWQYYQNTLTMIQERPWFGRGLGTFNVYYPLYRDNRVAFQLGEQETDFRIEHPHNEHLELLSDGGLIGYGLFLWVVIEALFALFRRTTLIERGLALALIGLLCDGLFSQNLRFIVIASLLWLLIGFANRRNPFYPPLTTPLQRLHVGHIAGGVIILAVVGAGLHVAYTRMQADAFVNTGMKAYTTNRPRRAIAAFEQALTRDPAHKRALYYLASAHILTGKQARARDVYTQLIAHDPNFLQTNYHLAALAFGEHDLEQARYYFERQVRVNNMDWRAYLGLALIARESGATARAVEYLQEIRVIHRIYPIPPEHYEQVNSLLARLYQQLNNRENALPSRKKTDSTTLSKGLNYIK
jgi:O-antigen ligase/Tfp pilus assembly protein PilF